MIEETVKRACAALEGGRCAVAVSGGIDSMVLLHLLNGILPPSRLLVAHFEHGIRGEDSLLDCDLVEKTAKAMGLPFAVRHEDIPSLAAGKNLEQVARERRYAFLYELEADTIFTAHHAGDNSETVLMKLLRGCGLDGLCGMEKTRGKLARPLLTVTREEIAAYAKGHQIAYREDVTNGDTRYTRNAVRHELVPFFVKRNPRFFAAMTRMTETMQQQRDFLNECVAKSGCIRRTEFGAVLEKQGYLALHPAVRQRAVKLLLDEMMGADVTHARMDDVKALFTLPAGKKKRLKEGLTAYSSYDGVCLVYDRPGILGSFPLKEGKTQTPFGCFSLERVTAGSDALKTHDKNTAYLPLSFSPLMVRARKSGDLFLPFGHEKPKKLKDVFIDEKVPVFGRDTFPLVVFQDQVMFLPGIGQSNASRVNGGQVFKLTFYRQKAQENGR